ncbi:tRNA (adenosine(37)-N6)-threonylcarbamoyltransferase complex dimerization subunit type 1 TsaB [Actinorhabdospora filicis]|uniref:tRNA (Adenosine(37)-N6)-threonylcarbamoyltransferase complex dimerization subunit type 1 TsaB n=1 Tax=Actinorhabdospora filicis TaxID=1785913 RepID=A0A9W6SIG7_9ACTN|nr:tRNA (adenosine(37)-N6)-threonylcarbamoyltransferase complex dimerization subunit type 1 TsaB [Actinorhabdospora filicis]GLZ76575.1 tRNA (adenosine(37)-N6)-threonylcarbamoyltransferase complex dimerization subunit type 1 TsaB [Actinorhabdospora filicis]
MFVLAVDTATPATSAAVAHVDETGVEIRATERVVDARRHGEELAPLIASALATAGITPGDLSAIVAGVGPGPFTGLRVGLVTAAAMGHALAVPTYGVCSLDAIGTLTTGRVLAATDARRREVYWAVYDNGERVDGPAVDKPAALAVDDVTSAVGDGAMLYAEVLGLPVAPEPRYPDLAAMVAVAAGRIRAGAPTEQLTPLYLRRPDAVPPPGVVVAS